MKLKNKVSLITGASKGIGKGIAVKYSKEGAKVVLASRSMDLLSSIAEEINSAGGDALALPLDVRKYDSVNEVVKKTVEEFGRLDVMVNNAGVAMAHPSEDLSPEDWALALETDLYGVFYGCQAAGKQMMKQDGGCIINMTSMYGLVAAPMRAAYCSSKAAGNMLTKVLASEWASKNIRVNAIAPGYILTELVEDVIEKGMVDTEAIKKRTPQGRIGSIEDVLGAAVYLACDDSSFVTGSVMSIDGGWTAHGYI